MKPIKDTPLPTVVTFQANGLTVILRRARRLRVYSGERNNQRLLAFCLGQGYQRTETRIGVIYRNWL